MQTAVSQLFLTTGVSTHRFDAVSSSSPRTAGVAAVPAPFLAEYARTWLESISGAVRPSTLECYRSRLNKHILPRFGDRRLDTLHADDIVGLITDLQQQGYTGWTIRSILIPLSRILAQAVRRDVIPLNPFAKLDRVERPRVWVGEQRILNRDEIDRLLKAASPQYRTLLATAIFSGLRQSELIGLQWRDIDFAEQVILVRRALDRRGKQGPPKTRHAVRDVVVMPALLAALEAHRDQSRYQAPDAYVFTTRTGRPIHWRSISRLALRPALAKAGIEPLRWHDLRHTFAGLLISGGANVVFVARQLGHGNPDLTLRNYAHDFDRVEQAQRVRDMLQEVVGSLL